MVGSEVISNAAAHPWNIRGHDSLSRHNVDELMISPAKRQAPSRVPCPRVRPDPQESL